MSKERLEEIKEAIANELGLSEQHLDGTYLYYLTRTKSAFSVGTVTLDDFEEVDGDLLEDIFNAIKPFVIEQAERAEYNNIWSERVRKYKEQNERYREYLGRLQRASKRYPTEDLPHVINKITSEALEDTQ